MHCKASLLYVTSSLAQVSFLITAQCRQYSSDSSSAFAIYLYAGRMVCLCTSPSLVKQRQLHCSLNYSCMCCIQGVMGEDRYTLFRTAGYSLTAELACCYTSSSIWLMRAILRGSSLRRISLIASPLINSKTWPTNFRFTSDTTAAPVLMKPGNVSGACIVFKSSSNISVNHQTSRRWEWWGWQFLYAGHQLARETPSTPLVAVQTNSL